VNNCVPFQRDRYWEIVRSFPARQKLLARGFWTEALLRANWEDRKDPRGRDVLDLKRGQFPMGWDEMAEDLGCSIQNLRTIVKRFESLSELTSKSTNRGTILTIVNYDIYTDQTNKINTQTNKQLTSNQQGTNNSKEVQEVEEFKEEKKEREDHGTLYAHPENLSLSDSKDLKLDTTKPVDRWVNAFHNHRPTAGHPFRNLSQIDIQDTKQRVQDLIDWKGEDKAIELLNASFATHPRPTSIKQALLACSKMIEQSTPKPIDATAAYVALPVEEKLKLYHAKQAALAEKMRLK